MRTFWVSFDQIIGFLLLLGMAAPFVLALWGVRREQRNAPLGRVPHLGFFSCGGFALGSILGLSLIWMGRCIGAPPGRGEKAETGYAIAAPVLAALERYRADHAGYPDSLRALVPGYLNASQLPVLQNGPDYIGREGFAYVVDSSGFALGFRYTGPGVNRCIYKSMTKRWSCSGYF
jgi:hypothetical protein